MLSYLVILQMTSLDVLLISNMGYVIYAFSSYLKKPRMKIVVIFHVNMEPVSCGELLVEDRVSRFRFRNLTGKDERRFKHSVHFTSYYIQNRILSWYYLISRTILRFKSNSNSGLMVK